MSEHVKLYPIAKIVVTHLKWRQNGKINCRMKYQISTHPPIILCAMKDCNSSTHLKNGIFPTMKLLLCIMRLLIGYERTKCFVNCGVVVSRDVEYSYNTKKSSKCFFFEKSNFDFTKT
jgi:hypothetical protein